MAITPFHTNRVIRNLEGLSVPSFNVFALTVFIKMADEIGVEQIFVVFRLPPSPRRSQSQHRQRQRRQEELGLAQRLE